MTNIAQPGPDDKDGGLDDLEKEELSGDEESQESIDSSDTDEDEDEGVGDGKLGRLTPDPLDK